MKRMEEIPGFEEYKIFKYTPSWLNLFGDYYPEKVTLRRVIRFLLAMPCGYEIYSLIKDEVVEGYCALQSGKTRRFDYTESDDLVVGPCYILPDFQGNALAAKLIAAILEYKKGLYIHAFAYIKNDNIASKKTVEKVGFSFYSNAYVTRVKANVKKTDDENTLYSIYRY